MFTMASVLQQSCWKQVGERAENAAKRIMAEGRAELRRVHDGVFDIQRDSVLMPDLETIALGQSAPCIWEQIQADPGIDRNFIDPLTDTRSRLTELILRCRPRAICQYNTRGPYVLRSCQPPVANPDLIVTSHISEVARLPPSLQWGAIHRYIFAPGLVFTVTPPQQLNRWDGGKVIAFIPQGVRISDTVMRDAVLDWDRMANPDATTEFYGLQYPPQEFRTALLPNDFSRRHFNDGASQDPQLDDWSDGEGDFSGNSPLPFNLPSMTFERREELRADIS